MTEVYGDDREVLYQFFAGYFHQDWDLDTETSAAVVALYMHDSTIDEIDCLKGAILRLVDCDWDNAELEKRLLRDLGCFYVASGAGQSAREWLQGIVAILSAKPQ